MLFGNGFKIKTMYTDIVSNLNAFKMDIPKTIVPSPTTKDYELGFIRRYFIQIENDSNGHLFEIDEETHTKYSENPLWKVVSIKWRISGPIETTYDLNGLELDKGVRNSNKAAIGLASSKIKNIGLYLPNLLQFYK
jgi:hypothetical protein